MAMLSGSTRNAIAKLRNARETPATTEQYGLRVEVGSLRQRSITFKISRLSAAA